MNKVFLIGNLTKDPEVRNTTTGKKVASFALAVNEGKDKVQYFNCSAWEKLADILEAYVKKGTKVAVVGSLQNRSWDKPDGTKAYATDIVVRELDILTSKFDQERMSSSQPSNSDEEYSQPNSAPATSVKENKVESLPEINVDDLNVQMPF